MSGNFRRQTRTATGRIILGIAALVAVSAAEAQPFTYTNNDLLLGFRKTGSFQESYEAVVNIGKASTYTSLAAGSSISVPNFSLAQLTPDSFSSLNDLNWSVFGYALTNLSNPLPGYVNNTLWLTVPRVNNSVQTTAPNRLNYHSQQSVGTQINSAGSNARFLSSQTTSNQDNTAKFIREPVNNTSDLSAFISGVSDSTASTFRDTWLQNNVENTTPDSFSGGIISDFYEIRPTVDSLGNPVTDPHTGLTSGAAYYVGYFQFNSSGAMTFTRASATTPPPPPPMLSIVRTNTTSTIYFATTNGATYKLYYTNAAGLGAPVSNWPSSGTTVTGDGTTKSLSDTTTDPVRIYKVGAH